MMKKTILIVGATGHQGGAVITALLRTDFAIRALVRDTADPKAQALAKNGIELVQANLDDPDSLAQAMRGAYGVFSVQGYRLGEREVTQGKNVADAALKSAVKHLVYSSVGGAERSSGIPHFEAKWRVEQHIRSIGLPATILRPVAFMENLEMTPPFMFMTLVRSVLKQKPLQLIAVKDIGKWAAVAFSQPQSFMGKAVEIAGDEVTYQQMQQAYQKVTGKPQASMRVPGFLLGYGGKMFTWFRDAGYRADLAYCRRAIPDTLTFEDWLRQRHVARSEPYPRA
jgi:uncharacterized protein YbjT (DUF2867 family)